MALFVEKIKIFENKNDDRLIELMKLDLLKDARRNNPKNQTVKRFYSKNSVLYYFREVKKWKFQNQIGNYLENVYPNGKNVIWNA